VDDWLPGEAVARPSNSNAAPSAPVLLAGDIRLGGDGRFYGDDGSELRAVDASVVFRPPVDAPVYDPFRAPDNPYGPGNRGIEYDTFAGQVVRAGAAGVVKFAGAVAGELFVTIDHGGYVLSSYSYLGRISVVEGQQVSQSQTLGITSEKRFHFSVRVNGEYIDPAKFLATKQVHIRLTR